MNLLFGFLAYLLLAVMVLIITIGIIKDPPVREIKRLLKRA